MSKGLKIIKEVQKISKNNKRKVVYLLSEYFLGKLFLQIAVKEAQLSKNLLLKNIGFLIFKIPFAKRKAEYHLKSEISASKEIGVKHYLSMGYLDLGLLYKAKKENKKARRYINKAIYFSKECDATGILKQSNEVLLSIN